MKRISIIVSVAFLLVICMTGCRKHIDPDAWKYDYDLPVPIYFGASSLTKGVELEDIEDIDLGIYGLEHGDSESIDWSSSPNVLLNNIVGTKEGDGLTLTGGPYYYPMDNHRNYSFYGYYPRMSGPNIKNEDGALVAYVPLYKNYDILWGYSLAEEKISPSDGLPYNGYNARYMRKIPDGTPTMKFRHVATTIQFNAKLQPGVTQEQLQAFEDIGFKITKVRLNPITNSLDPSVERKIPRTGKLYVAVENSVRGSDGVPVGTSPAGHKPGDLLPVTEDEYGYITRTGLDIPFNTEMDPSKVYKMGQFFLPPFSGESSDQMNVEIFYEYKDGDNKKNSTINVKMDISGKSFEVGCRYIYNIIIYPPVAQQIGVDVEDLEWQDGGTEEVDQY